MMSFCSLVYWIVFVKANIHPYLIFLTAGERGIPQGSSVEPKEMALLRRAEIAAAAEFWKAAHVVLNFPDLHLPFVPLQSMVEVVMPLVRDHGTDALFSFHPYETTKFVDHHDHTITGQVAQYVGTAADNAHAGFGGQVLKQRPALYYLRTKKKDMDIELPRSRALRQRRDDYAQHYYPSQFAAKGRMVWSALLGRILEGYEQAR